VDGRVLALAHPLDLRLAEVRGHPERAVLGERHQLLAGLHAVADVHRSLADDARDRGHHFRVAEVQLRLPQLRLRQFQVGVADGEARLPGNELARSVGACLDETRLRRLQPRLPLIDALARRRHRGLRHVRGAGALIELRLRDGLRGEELGGALLLLLRESVAGLRLIEIAPRRLEVRFGVRHLVLGALDRGTVRGHRDGHGRLLRGDRRLGLRHRRPRLGDGNFEIRRVQLDQNVALLHRLVVFDEHAQRGARNARGHRGDVPIHLGIVGVLELAGVQPPEQGDHGH
jgi:hypothetical protein